MAVERIVVFNRTDKEVISDLSSPCADPTSCDVSLGQLDPRDSVKTHIFFSVPSGTTGSDIDIEMALDNSNDPNPGNNQAQLTFKPAFLPKPLIESVESEEVGAVGSGQFVATFSGLALPNATVEIQIQGRSGGLLSESTTTDQDGAWQVQVASLSAGQYRAAARVVANGINGPRSKGIRFIVNNEPSVTTIRISDESGRSYTMGINDRDDLYDWGRLTDLPPGNYLLEVDLDNASPDVAVSIFSEILGQSIQLEDLGGDFPYGAWFFIPESTSSRGPLQQTIPLQISVGDSTAATTYLAEIGVADGPAQVMDSTTGMPITGAVVHLFKAEDGLLVDRSTQRFVATGQSATTDSNGIYSFLVSGGTYRIEVVAPGYQPYRSDSVIDANGLLALPVRLTPDITDAADATVMLDEQGSSLTVEIAPGDVLSIINIGQEGRLISGNGWESGLLLSGESVNRRFDTLGSYNLISSDQIIRIIVTDGSEPPVGTEEIFLPFILR